MHRGYSPFGLRPSLLPLNSLPTTAGSSLNLPPQSLYPHYCRADSVPAVLGAQALGGHATTSNHPHTCCPPNQPLQVKISRVSVFQTELQKGLGDVDFCCTWIFFLPPTQRSSGRMTGPKEPLGLDPAPLDPGTGDLTCC